MPVIPGFQIHSTYCASQALNSRISYGLSKGLNNVLHFPLGKLSMKIKNYSSQMRPSAFSLVFSKQNLQHVSPMQGFNLSSTNGTAFRAAGLAEPSRAISRSRKARLKYQPEKIRLDTVVHALARRPTPQTAHITRTSSRIYEPSSPPGYIIELMPTYASSGPCSCNSRSDGGQRKTRGATIAGTRTWTSPARAYLQAHTVARNTAVHAIARHISAIAPMCHQARTRDIGEQSKTRARGDITYPHPQARTCDIGGHQEKSARTHLALVARRNEEENETKKVLPAVGEPLWRIGPAISCRGAAVTSWRKESASALDADVRTGVPTRRKLWWLVPVWNVEEEEDVDKIRKRIVNSELLVNCGIRERKKGLEICHLGAALEDNRSDPNKSCAKHKSKSKPARSAA
ncbi:hypothetical protein C8J57DRAFT_1230358 [Mycena rebaudengoi]|nr:hypothetical protein C8J57DRAFT_1230358 [Mycena rebaudengoi]